MTHAVLLLSTADTELLAARGSGALYRTANPARVEPAGLPALLDGVAVVVLRLLGGRRAWPEGVDALVASGRPVVRLGGEAAPDAELMAASTVPAGVTSEALAYLAAGGRDNLRELHRFLSDTVLLTGEGFAPPVFCGSLRGVPAAGADGLMELLGRADALVATVLAAGGTRASDAVAGGE